MRKAAYPADCITIQRPEMGTRYAMSKSTKDSRTAPVDEPLDAEVLQFRAGFESRSPLDEIVREGARRMLQAAIDVEVDDFIASHSDRRE